MTLTLTADVASEPVSLVDAKAHMRIDTDHEDSLIERYITAAREQVQQLTGRAIGEQTYILKRPITGARIELPYPPLVSVDAVEINGDAFTDYEVIGNGIEPVSAWPAGTIEIEFTTGTPIPTRATLAILELAAHYEAFRLPVTGERVRTVPHTVDRLLRGLRVWGDWNAAG